MGFFLAHIAHCEIIFPKSDEYEELKEGFLKFGDFRGTVLTIDGTLIKISKFRIETPFDYYDRKG